MTDFFNVLDLVARGGRGGDGGVDLWEGMSWGGDEGRVTDSYFFCLFSKACLTT